eukprot:scaffold5097_cov52-Attheya_sp.AAC.11
MRKLDSLAILIAVAYYTSTVSQPTKSSLPTLGVISICDDLLSHETTNGDARLSHQSRENVLCHSVFRRGRSFACSHRPYRLACFYSAQPTSRLPAGTSSRLT